MISRFLAFIPLAGLVLAGCGPQPASKALERPAAIEAEGVYVHGPSGMAFPLEVGPFQRGRLTRYDAAGLDVGAGYEARSEAGPVAATVFVYPAPSVMSFGSPPGVAEGAKAGMCGRQYEDARDDAARGLKGARLVAEEPAAAPHGESLVFGRMAAFEAAGRDGPIRSVLYLYCSRQSPWAMKYRFTGTEEALQAAPVEAFMAGLPWPKPSGK
ncbi:hypothetical protein SH611_05000 [Geminicoccaceae bacterium 1502E]|nr:hypothetical protein [Geminicoccaceae bacterium 1502E]